MTTGLSDILDQEGSREGAPLSTLRIRAPSLRDIADQIAAQSRFWRLWTPVAFGLGAALYLTLKTEPPLWQVVSAAGGCISLAAGVRWRNRHRGLIALMALIAFFACGVLAAKLRQMAVDAPIAPASDRARYIEAYVVDVLKPGEGGPRLLLAPTRISGMRPEETPIRVRLTLPPGDVPPPGAAVSVSGIIGPAPPPASPGAYDFARDAYFDSIGAVGFTRQTPRLIELGEAPWRLELRMAINAVRWRLAERIVQTLGPETGGMAAAMVTGHEAWIAEEDTEAMRVSGLAHILSISGLHMAIVGGFAFALVRLLVALWPWLALRVSGKKLAALAGLVTVGGYLVLSGAPPPAERAAITAAVAFGAILLDRRAISLHALAVAALIILAVQPEAAAGPGFQMSFAATAALVALAQRWRRPAREISTPMAIRFVQAAGVWFMAGLAASFIAGLATGPFALHHFNRASTYGLLANLTVEPISTFVIMPFLALGAVLTPIGLGEPFLHVAGWGIGFMQDIAHWFAGLPLAGFNVASGPPGALVVSFLGVMLVCLWQGSLRWLGLPLACAVLIWPKAAAPEVWIASDGAQAAVRIEGQALMLRPVMREFAVDLWSRRRGLELLDDQAVRAGAFDCDRNRCLPLTDAPVKLAARFRMTPIRPEEWAALCAGAEIIILRTERTAACKGAVVLTAADFASGGAAELFRRDGAWHIRWAQPLRGERAWTGAVQ